jgi:hypothetical protein
MFNRVIGIVLFCYKLGNYHHIIDCPRAQADFAVEQGPNDI